MAAVSGTPGAALQARRFADYFASAPRIDNGVGLPLWLRVSRQGARVTRRLLAGRQPWHESQLELAELGDRWPISGWSRARTGERPDLRGPLR